MKTPILSALIVATVVSATPSRGWSQPAEMGKAIEKTLGQFFAAVTARDADAIRAVIDKQFVGMDVVTVAGMKSARIEYVSATDNQKLPPPEGNTDMSGFRVSNVNAEVSKLHPTAAIVSFTISRPLKKDQLERFRKTLARTPPPENGEPSSNNNRRAMIQRWGSSKQMQFSILAMLGRVEGQWKIICMSFP